MGHSGHAPPPTFCLQLCCPDPPGLQHWCSPAHCSHSSGLYLCCPDSYDLQLCCPDSSGLQLSCCPDSPGLQHPCPDSLHEDNGQRCGARRRWIHPLLPCRCLHQQPRNQSSLLIVITAKTWQLEKKKKSFKFQKKKKKKKKKS